MSSYRITILVITGVVIIGVIWALSKRSGMAGTPVSTTTVAQKAALYAKAQELVSPSGWINTQPFTLASLIGHKVILVDFWTYSCINCQRTMPYLKDWYAKYKDKGLVIVGVHTPEFDFEKDITNVQQAVTKFGIQYPVVLDNNYATWQAYENQYWPHEYLIDVDGYVVHDHIGEGVYDETEKAIQEALDELMARQGMAGTADRPIVTPSGAPHTDFSQIGTPELYLGSRRNGDALGNGRAGTDGTQTLQMPATGAPNKVYLSGTWQFSAESARCVSDCRLRLDYSAKQVNLVAGAGKPTAVTVFIDGKQTGTVTISAQQLYTLFEPATYGDHTLELEIGPGIDIFTLTFG